MKKQSLALGLGVAASLLLTACGGGGGDEEGPHNTIVKFDVLPITKVTVMAGGSVPLSSSAETFGPTIQAMKWVSSSATGSSKGTLKIEDPDCALGSLSSRAVPGEKSLHVGTGHCETVATVPEDAEGSFLIVGSVIGSDASQRTEKIEVKVLPKPKLQYDFSLKARAAGDVVINSPIRLVADPAFNRPLPDSAKMEYEWKLILGPGSNISSTDTQETYLVVAKPGKHVYQVKATLTEGQNVITKTAVVVIDIESTDVESAIGFELKAETKQPEVLVGSPANLVASSTANHGVGVSDVQYKWSQLTGPANALISNATLKSVFVTPPEPGTYVFLVESTITAGFVKETKSATVSVVVTEPTPDPETETETETGTGTGTGTGAGGSSGGTTVIGPN